MFSTLDAYLHAALAAMLAVSLFTLGCSAFRPAEPVAVAPETQPADPEVAAEPEPAKLRDLCRQQPAEGELLDETRRMLEETFCGATLWFDGLFGGEPNLENARAVSGRVELSTIHTEFEGTDFKARLRLRYELPTLERRINLFLGRDDRDELIEDRQEGFAIRSSVFGLETQEKWLAGLGYSPPGRWAKKIDVRVGARLKSAPEVFAQTRYRRNVFLGERDVWRFRETVFWENREGFGSTTSADFDHVLRRDLLLRWGSVGTFSESTEGLAWRTAFLAYHNLRRSRAVAGEIFVRGSTRSEVKLNEYGTRAVYRQPVGKPFFFGELIAGYTWPRFERDEPREGSLMLGFGVELLFGRQPY
ncbi:MAG TPA: hypothetical protein VE078_04605 [Thermoanaerobaculia bacterium]|nr:hypothetical protein [Thermoanaerobaculia bacterium]